MVWVDPLTNKMKLIF